MKHVTYILSVFFTLNFLASNAVAGGSKPLDAYMGEYVSAGKMQDACPYNLDIHKWATKSGHVIAAGNLFKGNIPKDAFSPTGHLECRKQGNTENKVCTKILAMKSEKKGNDLAPSITISQAKYFLKNGDEHHARILEPLKKKIIMEDDNGKLKFTHYLADKGKASCTYRKAGDDAAAMAQNPRVQSQKSKPKRQLAQQMPAAVPMMMPAAAQPVAVQVAPVSFDPAAPAK